MQRLFLSTADLPEPDRFAYWREAVNESIIGVTGERRSEDQRHSFDAQVDATVASSICRFRYHSDGFYVTRGSRQIARQSWEDRVWLYRERGDGAWFNHAKREYTTRKGDLIVADPTVPFETDGVRDYEIDIWFFPRRLLDPHLPGGRLPTSALLSGNSGLSGVVLGYLDSVSEQLDRLGDAEAGIVADNFCRLIATACGAPVGEHRESIRAARLEEAKRHIRLHLADPTLDPETTAAALKISVRRLHLLFEPGGTSFSQYVLQQRLEECRAALLNPLTGSRSITDIALGWGFNSLGTFYRNFQHAFGTTPSELRAEAQRAR